MENETPSSTSSSRPANPSGAASSGIPDRQTVQVIQQALTRQPNTAAQYLQQMYAAQQQHLMLQTAALQQQQQQHLSSAQLQSLAAAQQANIAASRAPPAVSTSQQSPPQPLTIIQRPQTISSAPPTSSGIAQQAVLLGNTASPGLSANQAQMYLRAQMLIFTPTATVSNIQSEVSPGASSQVQNLAVRGAGVSQSQLPSYTTATSNLLSQSQLPSYTTATSNLLSQSQLPSYTTATSNLLSQSQLPSYTTTTSNLLPVTSTSQTRTTGNPQSDPKSTESRGATGRTLVPVTAHPIITTACTPHLIQPQKQIQPRPVLPSVGSSGQPLTHQCLTSPAITSLAVTGPSSTCAETNGHRQSPITSLAGQEVTVQPKLLPVSSAVILQIPAAPGTNHPAAETLYKHGSTISPSLVKVQPPVPVHAAAVSITRAANPYQAHESAHTGVPGSDSCPPLDMTSGNGSSPIPAAATGNTPQNGENKPPQAVVKPQILTHVIEGFVIQEGAQPFPSHRSRAVLEVGRSSLLVGSKEKHQQQGPAPEKQPQQDANAANAANTTTASEIQETIKAASKIESSPPKMKCELCGRVDLENKFKRSKRFCSMACAKRYNVGCTKRVGLFHPERTKVQKPAVVVVAKPTRRRSRKSNGQSPSTEEAMQMPEPITPISVTPLTTTTATTVTSNLKHSNSQDSIRCSDNSSYEEPLSPMSASSSLSRRGPEPTDLQGGGDPLTADHEFLPSDPTKWNVEDVYEFIRSLPGCQEISEEFRAQEIDGQALLLLKEDHLMSTMNIKLGPALKLYARISMLKDS